MKYSNFFKEIVNETIIFEGGIVNNKDDIGKLTYKGISRVYNTKWEGWKIIDKVIVGKNLQNKDVRKEVNIILGKNEELLQMIIALYYSNFWKKNCDKLVNFNLSSALFDFGVNAGVGRAAKILQEIVGTKSDGAIGPNSLKCINAYIMEKGEMDLILEFTFERIKFYLERVILKPKQITFIYGWCLRVINLFNKFYDLDNMDENYLELSDKYNSVLITNKLRQLKVLSALLNKCKVNYKEKNNIIPLLNSRFLIEK